MKPEGSCCPRDQLGNHARDEPDDDRPDYVHSALLMRESSRAICRNDVRLGRLFGGPRGCRQAGENSASAGSRPCGVYLSTASGSSRQSLVTSSSRDRPVCFARLSNTSGPIAFSSWRRAALLGPS